MTGNGFDNFGDDFGGRVRERVRQAQEKFDQDFEAFDSFNEHTKKVMVFGMVLSGLVVVALLAVAGALVWWLVKR